MTRPDTLFPYTTHFRSLVRGGALGLREGAGGQGWIDLVFGLTEGWWRFADREVRPGRLRPISTICRSSMPASPVSTAPASNPALSSTERQPARDGKIGRASCRERVCPVRVVLGGRRLIKKTTYTNVSRTFLFYTYCIPYSATHSAINLSSLTSIP